jgi:uncharacterized membrane protein HdeD (DUF308 family)
MRPENPGFWRDFFLEDLSRAALTLQTYFSAFGYNRDRDYRSLGACWSSGRLFRIANVLIGLLLLSLPVPEALTVPFVFGALLLIQGVASIVFAFRFRA